MVGPARRDEDAADGVAGRGHAEAEVTVGAPAVKGAGRVARLAAEQGVQPVTRFEALLGDFWPADEGDEDFLATLRAWREDRPSTGPR
jgi:hypothetical protein